MLCLTELGSQNFHIIDEHLLQEDELKMLVDQMPRINLMGRRSSNAKKQLKDLDGIVEPVSIENIRKLIPDFRLDQDPEKNIVLIQYKRDAQTVSLLIFVTPDGEGFIVRLPLLEVGLGLPSSQIEQIVRMYRFKLQHYKRFEILTEREVEVLQLLANGYNNPEIAEKLFLSRQTIETHRKNLKRKLELRCFLDLMRYAFVFNLVEV